MITISDIDREELRIAEEISKQYRENKMSALDLGYRLKFLSDYSELARRAVKGMNTMEFRL